MTDSSLTAAFRSRGVPLLEFGPGARVPLGFGDPVAEHRATRTGCGLYDFSFMGCHEIRGPSSLDFLHRLQTRNLAALAPGALCYTLLCRIDGSVLNDATVWCHGPRHYWLFTGRREDHGHIAAAAAGLAVNVSDISGLHSVLAVQGPLSAQALRRLVPPGDGLPRYFHHRRSRLADREAWIARIGYSGELGYELVVESEHGPALWQALAQAVADCRGLECGFQAADALRIEAGYILFARELAAPVTPFELGLGRLVSFSGRGFMGEAALRKRRWNEPERRLVGLVPGVEGCVPPEQLLAGVGGDRKTDRAQITSAAWSPLFGRMLGLGLVAAEHARPGSRLALAAGVRAEVARLPFYDPAKRLPRLEPD